MCVNAVPSIVSVQCDDGGADRVLGAGDSATLHFSTNTSVLPGTLWNVTQVMNILNPSVGTGLGSNFTAFWLRQNLVRITVWNATGANPSLRCNQVTFRVSSAANIRDVRGLSAPSAAVSTPGMANGSFALSDVEGMAFHHICAVVVGRCVTLSDIVEVWSVHFCSLPTA